MVEKLGFVIGHVVLDCSRWFDFPGNADCLTARQTLKTSKDVSPVFRWEVDPCRRRETMRPQPEAASYSTGGRILLNRWPHLTQPVAASQQRLHAICKRRKHLFIGTIL